MTEIERLEYDRQYQIGDVVEVFPDGRLADTATAGGKFYVVRVSGLKLENAKAFADQWLDPIEVDVTGTPLRKRRRLYQLDLSVMPAADRAKLESTHVLNTTLLEVQKWILNKATSAYVG